MAFSCVLSEGFPKPVITAAVGDADLPATAAGPIARYDGDDLVSLVAANGTAQLAAAHVPAERGDVDALRADLSAALGDIAELQVRMGLLDPQVRAAASAALD